MWRPDSATLSVVLVFHDGASSIGLFATVWVTVLEAVFPSKSVTVKVIAEDEVVRHLQPRRLHGMARAVVVLADRIGMEVGHLLLAHCSARVRHCGV